MRKKTFVILLIFFLAVVSISTAKTGVGGKDESDVIMNAINEAAKGAIALPGLQGANRIGVLVVREPWSEPLNFGESGIKINFWDFIPIVGLLMSKTYTEWSAISIPKGECPLSSHSPMIEDLIIHQLVKSGKFKVIETVDKFYGQLSNALNEDMSTEGLLKDPAKIANIGKVLGVDTIIIGSAGGSMLKKVTKETAFRITTYFIANVKLNLRTVDVKNAEITSSIISTGSDSAKIRSEFKMTGVLQLLHLFAIIDAISAAGETE